MLSEDAKKIKPHGRTQVGVIEGGAFVKVEKKVDLADMTKGDLKTMAEEVGIDPTGMKVAELRTAINNKI